TVIVLPAESVIGTARLKHTPLGVIMKLPPEAGMNVGEMVIAAGEGFETVYGGVPPKTNTCALRAPVAQRSTRGPVNVTDEGTAKKKLPFGLTCAMKIVERWKAPVDRSVIWKIPVWFAAVVRTRNLARAVPVSSVVVVTERAVVSGSPGPDVMKRKSPDTTSKRTRRPGIGMPPCEITVETTASPPEQIAGAHAVEAGVTVIVLLTVPGRTTSVI